MAINFFINNIKLQQIFLSKCYKFYTNHIKNCNNNNVFYIETKYRSHFGSSNSPSVGARLLPDSREHESA